MSKSVYLFVTEKNAQLRCRNNPKKWKSELKVEHKKKEVTVERRLIGNIIHQQNSHGSTVVCCNEKNKNKNNKKQNQHVSKLNDVLTLPELDCDTTEKS